MSGDQLRRIDLLGDWFLLRTLCISALTALVGALPASADLSFNPAEALDALVGAERATFETLSPDRLTKITAFAPKASLVPPVKPAAPAVTPDEVWLSRQPDVTDGGKAWQCLTEALYFEARGETHYGIFAVAEVIMNRVDSPRFPNTVCGVVQQGTGKKHQCQFSFTCDGRPETVTELGAYARMGKVAKAMLDGAPRPLTGGATFYHTTGVNPRWAARLSQTAQIGVHRFYRR